MKMFDMNVCYKIAFDALYENLDLGQVAEKLRDYIHASVFFIEVTGKIPFYASAMPGKRFLKARNKQLSVELYDYIMKKIEKLCFDYYCIPGNNIAVVKKSEVNGRIYGYIVILFKEVYLEARDDFAGVADLLATVMSDYYRNHQYRLDGNISMRNRLISHDILYGKSRVLKYLSHEIAGNYILVYFPENDNRNLLQIMGDVGRTYYVQMEDSSLWALFYHIVDNKEEASLLDNLKKIQSHCCVSSLFSDLMQCERKIKWLRRMDLIRGNALFEGGIMLENEWYAETMYSYAHPILKTTGLSDYSVQILRKEDQEKNTEFYKTLKMYFLCGHNIVETATMMHIHRNTLTYRLKRIRELIGTDIDDVKKSGELLAFMMMSDYPQLDGGEDK